MSPSSTSSRRRTWSSSAWATTTRRWPTCWAWPRWSRPSCSGGSDLSASESATRGRANAPGRFITGPFCLTGVAVLAQRSFIRCARPGGRIVPLDRQEPAPRRVALRHGRRFAGRLLLPLARPTAAHRADRLRNARGFCALGPGRLDPASQAGTLPAAGIAVRSLTSFRSFIRRSWWRSSRWPCGLT